MNQQVNLIVFAISPKWTSAIKRYFPDAKTTWVLNVNQLEIAASTSEGESIVVEFTNQSILDCCATVQRIHRNSRQQMAFAIGQPKNWQSNIHEPTQTVKNQISSLGFAFWARSILQMPSLQKSVLRHQSAGILPFTGTIEERISLTLPWATAAADDQA